MPVDLTGDLGHGAKDCKNNRVFDMSSIADATAEVAWENLEKADAEKDLDEVRAVSESATIILTVINQILGHQSVQQGSSGLNLRSA